MNIIKLIVIALVASSCGVKKLEPSYGKTTTEELIQMVGAPEKEEAIPVADSKMLHYANGDKYQVKNGIVENSFLSPVQEETTLIYWKHAFKDCDVKIEDLTKEKKGHEKSDLMMKCDSLGTAVIYNEDASHIQRVLKYEKK